MVRESVDPVLLYDGDCAFCSSCVRAAERFLGARGWRAEPFQFADFEALGEFTHGEATRERAERQVLWITPAGKVAGGAQAAARLLMRAGGAWSWLGAMLTLPGVRQLAALAYHLIAVNRHRLPGGTPACAVGAAEGREELRG